MEVTPEQYHNEEDSLSVLDVLLILARHRRLIYITTAAGLVLGLLIAILSPTEYTSRARVIRETGERNTGVSGGLAALQGLGLNIGSTSMGVTVETYPDIVTSREVRLEVARSQLYFSDLSQTMPLVDYYSRPPGFFGLAFEGLKNVTIGLPRTLMGLFRDSPRRPVDLGESGEPVYPTEDEEKTIEWLYNMVSVDVDRNTGIMSIAVTTLDPLLSSQIAQIFIERLTKRVQDIYTQKARENLEFIQARFEESEGDLQEVEAELAAFLDANRDPTTARLQTEMERLQRNVTFKTNLYSDLQTELTQAEIELQRSQPVITILEAPVPPLEPSGPGRKIIVMLLFLFGIGVGVAIAAIKHSIEGQQADPESREKLAVIREAFIPKRLRKRENRSLKSSGDSN